MADSRVYLIGVNGNDHIVLKNRQKGKAYLETKEVCYRTKMDGFVRMKRTDYKGRKSDAEVIVYVENGIYPIDNPKSFNHPDGIEYSATAFISEITLDKDQSTTYGKKHLMESVGGLWAKYGKFALPVFTGIVLVFAFGRQFLGM